MRVDGYQVSLAAMCFAIGCSGVSMDKYNKAVASGKEAVPSAKDIYQRFPNANSFISHYKGGDGGPVWNTEIGLHGRYVIHLNVNITLDGTMEKVISAAEPTFIVKEIGPCLPP